MNVRDYLNVLVRRRLLVAVVLLASLAAAAAFATLSPRSWTSTATLRVEPGAAVVGGEVHQDDITYLDRLVNTYAKLADSRQLAAEVKQRMKLADAPDVGVVPVPSTNLVNIKATAPGARTASRAANVLGSLLIEQVQQAARDAERDAQASFSRRALAQQADIARARLQLDAIRGRGDRAAEMQLRERIASDQASLEAERTTFESYQAGREARANGITLAMPATLATMAGPRTPEVLAIALVLGSIVAAGAAFVAENLSGSFRSRAELEASVQSLVLATIPRVPGAARHATFNSGSEAEEAYRRLRTTLLLRARDDLQSILVTSAEPGEGKSTVVANLGRALAQSGCSVVLVDADLRAPRLHELFGEPEAPGLSELLAASVDAGVPSTGQASNGQRDEAILLRRLVQALHAHEQLRRGELAGAVGRTSNDPLFGQALALGLSSGVLASTGRGAYLLGEELAERWLANGIGVRYLRDVPGLAVLPAGGPVEDPATLLGSRAAERLLEELATTFDFVLVDSPAVLAVPDALAISYSVDEVLLVARSTVQREALLHAHDELARVGARPLGVVLNGVSDRGLYPYLDYRWRKRPDDLVDAGVSDVREMRGLG
jgi:Mrp family chromosome partitioning ATPase